MAKKKPLPKTPVQLAEEKLHREEKRLEEKKEELRKRTSGRGLPSNKVERPEGKYATDYRLVYDIQSLPKKLDPANFMKLVDSGIIFYDSEAGNRPKLYKINLDEEGKSELVPQFVDITGKTVDIDTLMAEYKDNEFWKEELYKCRQSPLYYYNHYVSTSPKPTREEVEKYLQSINMAPVTDTDKLPSEEERMKIHDDFAKSVKLEDLKAMKPVRDSLDEQYLQETREMTNQFADQFGISRTHDKRILQKLRTELRKTKAKTLKEHIRLEYILPHSGRWDNALLKATDVDVLIRVWRDQNDITELVQDDDPEKETAAENKG